VQLLTAAIRTGNVERVQDLLPQPSGLLGFSLLEAVCSGHRDILELVLDAAAGAGGGGSLLQPSPADAQGRTALHFAAANGDYSAAQLLLARGADVDVSLPESEFLSASWRPACTAVNASGGPTNQGDMRQQQAHAGCIACASV
jgi:ankyrin repeat protein